jgi:hypothetical protein
MDMWDMLNQISWAYNCHCSHRNWQHCPTRLFKFNIQVNVPITRLAYKIYGWYNYKDVSIKPYDPEQSIQSLRVATWVAQLGYFNCKRCIPHYARNILLWPIEFDNTFLIIPKGWPWHTCQNLEKWSRATMYK